MRPDDVLDVYIYDVPELSPYLHCKPFSGTVAVPLTAQSDTNAPGARFAARRGRIFPPIGSFLRRPEIAVSVRQSRTRRWRGRTVKTPPGFSCAWTDQFSRSSYPMWGIGRQTAGVDLTITRLGPVSHKESCDGGRGALGLADFDC